MIDQLWKVIHGRVIDQQRKGIQGRVIDHLQKDIIQGGVIKLRKKNKEERE